MAKSKSNAADIRAELVRLQAQLKEAQRGEEETAGKLARKSGLLDLGLSDKELLEAMRTVVAGFRKSDDHGRGEQSTKAE